MLKHFVALMNLPVNANASCGYYELPVNAPASCGCYVDMHCFRPSSQKGTNQCLQHACIVTTFSMFYDGL